MKKVCLFLIMAVAALATTQNADAKIWRVNNNAGKSGVFNVNGNRVVVFADLTSALQSLKRGGANNVNKGDTIHIEGSVTPYGKTPQTATNCDTVYKKVVIIGPGYLLGDNPETQHYKESAKIRTLFIAKEAGGTVIAGMEQLRPTNVTTGAVDGYLINGYILETARVSTPNVQTNGAYLWGNNPNANKMRINADSVTITHSKLFYVDILNDRALSNITITKCIFNPGLIAATAGSYPVTNLIISNNFFRNARDYGTHHWPVDSYSFLVIDLRGTVPTSIAGTFAGAYETNISWPVAQPTIQNNTFYRDFNLAVKAGRLYNNIFFAYGKQAYRYGLPMWPNVAEHDAKNNIIYNGSLPSNCTWGSPTPITTTFESQYGNSYGNMLNDGNNIYSNVAETSWFTSSTSLPALDKSFVLGSGSPARSSDNAETKQRGMFGGLAPYVLSGLYTIPAVWEISIPAYPSGEVPSTGFEVRVKVKSH
jgi:hypothetical protein